MKILIIGNGFDLAHDLPTKYIDFLRFVNELLEIGGSNDAEDSLLISKITNQYETDHLSPVNSFIRSLENAPEGNNEHNILEQLISLIDGNIWFRWLNKRVVNLGQNWVDFEAEICDVIKAMEVISEKLNEYERNGKNNFTMFKGEFKGFYKTVLDFFFSEAVDISGISIQKIKTDMLSGLNNLIRCFEIYLSECVEHIEPDERTLDISNIAFDKVLSFNYTDTYSRLYCKSNSSTEVDYLHGKIRSDTSSSNNMVLGIDEYLCKEDQYTNTMFIEFKKYFQRIHKRTGCKYKQWFDEINKSTEKSNAYIFGHSLAATDKDILLEFLNNDKIVTTVFYRNDESYADLIINLVKLLGVDELTAKVHGRDPHIIFRQQRSMKKSENKSLQNSTS